MQRHRFMHQGLTRQSITLAMLLLAIIAVVVWSQWPTTQLVSPTLAAGEIYAQEQTPAQNESPLPATPTPLAPMPTPAMTLEVGDDWQTFSSPYWGVSFQYPPGWELDLREHQEILVGQVGNEKELNLRPGPPIYLNSPEGRQGTIFIALNYYLLSKGGSLAEWIKLKNSYSDILGLVDFNLDLYTIPSAYLQNDVQGIYAIGPNPVRPGQIVWVEHDGLVFEFHSTYGRAQDMAVIFAIISSMQFEQIPSERLTATNSFLGDENTLREKIAHQKVELANFCDSECERQKEYNMRMEALHNGMIQPPRDRPMMQALHPALDDGSWQTYTQTVMGISFRYPSDALYIVDPFVENGLDESSAVNTSLLIRDSYANRTVLEIEISPYTVSPDVPLHNWEAIQDQINRAVNPENQFRYRMPVPINNQHIPQESDDIVETRQQAGYYQLDTFWASKDGVVYRFTNNDLSVLGWATGIFATVEFDTEQIAKLRDMDIFLGDERDMVDELATLWDRPPTPTPDPQWTPTPYPTVVPYPTRQPTPTAAIVTVTPSVFNSPLADGLMRYEGTTTYTTLAPYEFFYDPSKWQLLTYEPDSLGSMHSLHLRHQHLIDCTIALTTWLPYLTPLEPITLGGRPWMISFNADMLGRNKLIYSTEWGGGVQQFVVTLQESIREPYDPNTKTLCELQAEAVFDTLVVLDQATPEAMPTITPTP